MKKIILFLLFIALAVPQVSNASHMAGGEMWYEFTGDANNPYDYRIWVQFYRDVGGIAAPMNEEISIKSSCFPVRCVNLTFTPFTLQPGSDTSYGSVPGSILTPDLAECVDPTSGGTFVQTEIYRFYADVTLDGKCNDWTFGFNENARNASDNLATAGTFYIETMLNNMLGPNSSPVFVTPAAKSFCVGSPFVWSQAAVEPDNDSLLFDFGTPYVSADACPTTPNQVSFNGGWTQSQPMRTANGITIDHSNGTFSFTPSQTEVDVINVTVIEYRWDPTTQAWIVIGSSIRDIQTPIMASCKSSATTVQMNAAGFNDSVTAELACGDSIIRLKTSNRVECGSIEPNGTDFALFNSLGNVIPITAAGTDSCSSMYSNSLWLKIHDSIHYNDTLTLVSRKGNDLNTLINACGYTMNEGDSLQFVVQTCSTDVDLDEYSLSGMGLYPNPVRDLLTVELPHASSKGEIAILNIQGTLLIKQRGVYRQNELPVGSLPEGMYLIRHTEGERWQTLKFKKL